MAEYGGQYSRFSSARPGFAPSSSAQRDDAFSNIFGAAPPGGRSQTLTSQSAHPFPDRAQTLTGNPSEMMGRIPPVRHQSGGGSMTNGYQIPNGTAAPPLHHQQPQPQYLPRPVNENRRPFRPERIDSRPGPAGGPPMQNRPFPQRPQPAGQAPTGPPGSQAALNTNSYRSQSMATTPRPQYQGPSPGYGGAPPPSRTFRQQPYTNQMSRTTAQGRVVPERHDERTMSMTSFGGHSHEYTMSGRQIPRRRESAQDVPNGAPEYHGSQHPHVAGSRTRAPSDAQGSRTMSLASTATAVNPSDRSFSMSSAQQPTRAASGASTQQKTQQQPPRRRAPLVYPALLSKVAELFREKIGLADKEKDGLVYKGAFTGSEAVDLISYIMQTTDRNLALLLGRSLDAQKFFHDVTYDHRLRDSSNEVYQFRETLHEDQTEVNGIFTLVTDCYSPTCTPDRLCYSIACPRRVDQQKRLNMRPQAGLKREESRASLHEEQSDEQKLWINTVPKHVAESVSDREKKRQEVISEIMYTERDFVKDLEYLRDFWMKPLRSPQTSSVPEHRREKFVRTVFSNCQEIYAVNSKMAEILTKRQQQDPVVHNVGDIFLEFIPRFGPFIKYGANQLFGKYEFEKEKQSNYVFAKFVEETERLKESRKLELNGYLTKPTTRLARYPLLLENVLKYTEDGNSDKIDIPKAITGIRDVLSKVNVESGKAENHFTLLNLNQSLVWRPGEYVDLKLTEESRQMLFKGILKKSPTDTAGDIQAFLFDNAILFVRVKTVSKREELKVYKKPIPLGLLVITADPETNVRLGLAKRPSSSLIPGGRNPNNAPGQDPTKQQGYPLTFRHLGKGGFEQTLYCQSQIQREKWVKVIEERQKTLREHEHIFTNTNITEGFFTGPALRINCAVPIDGGRKLVVGTDTGLYVTDRRHKGTASRPHRVIDTRNITQVDVLEQHSILLVLSDKNLYSYSTEALDPDESPLAPSKRGRKISAANFFKIGVFYGEHLVCCVKTTSLSTTIKVYKPMDSMIHNKKKSGLAKMLAGGQEVLKPHKEFYIPTETYSIHFLRSSLCVGCARGFEIVTLDTLVTQPLLDQADTSLDFVAMKENLRPIHVERLNQNFLLCYSDFSFFVNRHGWRAFPDWKITWEGTPQSFAIFQPYVLAFEPSFIEIRIMDTGSLVYILTAKNVRMLHSSTREILYAYENENGEDVIASLDFWARPQ